MRVSTSQIYSIANIGMRDAQVSLDKTNQQISSGKRVLSPADDPVAATSILALNQELSRTTQYSKNINIADNNLTLEDTTLQSVLNLVQRLKELAVSAGNTAVLTKSDYQAISAEVDSRLQELVNLQNTRNSSGQYIFAGYQSQTQPFVNQGGGNYTYQGDEGQMRVQASTTVTVAVSDSGQRVFENIPSSNNTFTTSAATSNKSSPAAIISVGEVFDQETFDKFYPSNMQVTFNAVSSVTPAAANYTVTDRSTGKILVANQLYVSGGDIEVMGAKFSITGNPYPGTVATPATLSLGAFSAQDFSADNGKIKITVGNVTETLDLDQNITSIADLVTQLGGDSVYPNANPISSSPSANANYAKLQHLGITLSPTGVFTSANGLNINIQNDSPTITSVAAVNLVTGFATGKAASTDGVVAQAGDKFFLESTDKQSLLSSVSRFSEAMKNVLNNPDSKADLAKIIGKTLTNFENAITNITTVQGDVGARQNMLESSTNLNADISITTQTVLSQLQDLDYAEASTRLQMQTMVLSAAQQSFIRVSELSLFKYM